MYIITKKNIIVYTWGSTCHDFGYGHTAGVPEPQTIHILGEVKNIPIYILTIAKIVPIHILFSHFTYS